MSSNEAQSEQSVLETVSSFVVAFSRFTARSARRGYERTKRAVKSMSLKTLVPGSASHFARKVKIRQLFKMKHSRELGVAGSSPAESSDEDESDEEDDEDANASVEQLYHKVDRRFFSDDYDPVRSELEALRVTYAEDSAAVEAEMRELDDMVTEHQEPLNVVSHVLKKRILGNYSVFLQGVWQISAVNEDLKTTASECSRGRGLLNEAKDRVVVGGLRVVQLNRRRNNLLRLAELVRLMISVQQRHDRFFALLIGGQFKEAIRMTQSERSYPGEDALPIVMCLRDEVAEWHKVITDPLYIREFLNRSMEDCVRQRFNSDRYMVDIEGYFSLNDPPSSASNVVALALWDLADQLLAFTVSELSVAQDENDIKVLARGINPENIIPCMCRIGAKALDMIAHYRSIITLHEKAIQNVSFSKELRTFHNEVRSAVAHFGARIAVSWYNQMSLVLQGLPIHALDLEKVLHVFHIAMLITEAISLFGTAAETTAGARAAVKLSLTNYISKFHQQSARGSIHLLNRMQEDTWRVEPNGVTPSMFKSVAPLSPLPYKQKVKWVKSYVMEKVAQRQCDNPFFSEELMLPQDVTRKVDVVPFGASETRTVVTSTSVVIANFIFEFLVRVAVRFPPIANEVVIWCEELVALYFFVAASNFSAPMTPDVPLEEQSEFTATTKQMLCNIRQMSLTCAPHLQGRNTDGLMFPPLLHGPIEDVLKSSEHSFGLVERVTAIEAVFPLLGLLREALVAVSPLLTESVRKEQSLFLDYFEQCAEEVLQVTIYRMSEMIFEVEWLSDEAAKTKYEGRSEMYPSRYAIRLADRIKEYHNVLQGAFPSQLTEVLFWRHFLFVIERALLKGYSKAGGLFLWQKLSDIAVSQMRVDVQVVGQAVKETFAARRLTWGEYIDGYLRAFFLGSFEQQLTWVKTNHKKLLKSDVIAWFGVGDRDRRHTLEALLEEVSHEDCLRCF